MTSRGRAGHLDRTRRRTLHRTVAAFIAASVAAFLLAGCGGPAPSDAETGTVLVDLALAQTLPAVVDSGTRVSGQVTVRTDERGGIRVWFRPIESPGEDLYYSYAGSGLIDGPEFTVERDFRVLAADDDVSVDGVRVTARSSSGEIVLDEVVGVALTYRSLATTTVTVTPSTGSLEQGQPVDVALAFELDTPRDVTVTVEPLAPDGYDYDVGPWSDRRQAATDTFTGVTTGDLAASLTVLDLMEGPATIDRLLVTITDPTVGAIYTTYVDVDLTFGEPSP